MFREINELFIDENIEDIKEHSWIFILGTYLIYISLLIFIVFVVYANHSIDFIQIMTNDIIQLTLIASFFVFSIVVLLIIQRIGKMKANELGLKKVKVKEGLLFYGILYVILNIILVILNLTFSGSINFYPYWNETGLFYGIGYLIGQIFGNVLVEETYFRGYLFSQITKKFHEKKPEAKFRSILFGLLISSFLFSVMHIPIRILYGVNGIELVFSLLLLFGMGAVFTLSYIFTNNLFIAMVIHISTNISFVLFYPIIDTGILIIPIGFVLIFLLLFIKLKRE